MKVVLGALVVAVIGAVVAVWVRWLRLRQGVWQEKLADAIPINSKYWREQKKLTGDLLYVAIGDSAAQGIGASRPSHGYVGVLARHIRAVSARELRVANLGISGATVRMAIDTELPALAGLEPDILTVCIGANDIANFDADRFGREIEQLFAALPSHAIVADLPSFYFLPGQKKVKVANILLRDAAARHNLAVVDLHRLTDREGLFGIVTQFAADLFHPNDRGYRIWAAAFEPAVHARLAQLG